MAIDPKQLEIMLDLYGKNLDYALRLTANLPQEKWAHQPAPDMNHASWVIGHLARTSDVVGSMVDGKPSAQPENWGELFGPASKPSPDASTYADSATLLAALKTAHERVINALKTADAAVLYQPPAMERLRSRFPTTMSFVTFAMLSHESIHLGQLSAWRRVQGMPSV